jgi:hypothetical protein
MMAHPVGETTPEPEHPRPGAALGGPGVSTNIRQGATCALIRGAVHTGD